MTNWSIVHYHYITREAYIQYLVGTMVLHLGVQKRLWQFKNFVAEKRNCICFTSYSSAQAKKGTIFSIFSLLFASNFLFRFDDKVIMLPSEKKNTLLTLRIFVLLPKTIFFITSCHSFRFEPKETHFFRIKIKKAPISLRIFAIA